MSADSRLAVLLTLTLLALLSGCAKAATGQQTQAPTHAAGDNTATVLVHGNLSFHARYRRLGGSVSPESAAQPGLRGLTMIRVCLVRARGVKDFRLQGQLGDDVILGCSVTDFNGNYAISGDASRCPRTGCDGRYYLVTDLCSVAAGHAQTCPAINTALGRRYSRQPWDAPARWRKFMWSDTYNLTTLERNQTISWNLSCPSTKGFGIPVVECEQRSIDPPGRFAATNSNFGFNHEAIHAAQAGGLVVRRLGDLRPNRETTLQENATHCGGSNDRLSDKKWFCQDAIRIVVTAATRFGDGKNRPCSGIKPNVNPNPRTVCTKNPDNPSIVAHEIGHAMHARFMNYRGGLNANGGPNRWASGPDQKTQTAEGWANFFSAAVLFERDAVAPDFNGRNIEDSNDRRLAGSCTATSMVGEGRTAQFFWDIYDHPSTDEPWDTVSVDLRTMLEVWSLFPGKHGRYARDRAKGECDPHGRNTWDFAYHFDRHPDDLGDLRSVQVNNCVDRQLRTMSCR